MILFSTMDISKLRKMRKKGVGRVSFNRWQQWVDLSQIFKDVNPFFIVTIQGLGRIDALIAEGEADYLAGRYDYPPSLEGLQPKRSPVQHPAAHQSIRILPV